MGKHIKTKMDYDMIYDFAKEIAKLGVETGTCKVFKDGKL